MPKAIGDIKTCSKCFVAKHVSEYWGQKAQADGFNPYCKECSRQKTRDRQGYKALPNFGEIRCAKPGCKSLARYGRLFCSKKHGRFVRDRDKTRNIKLKALALFGNKCSRCGYSTYISALSFHHKDPKVKSFLVTRNTKPWHKIEAELEKCELLCSNCHYLEHWLLDQQNSKKDYQNAWRRARREKMLDYRGHTCINCSVTHSAYLTFHHREPENKSFSISQTFYRWDRMVPELDKCDLLCQNCHSALHNSTLLLASSST